MTHHDPFADLVSDLMDFRVSKVRVRRSLLCSDIVAFTTMLSRLGDTAALQLVRRHDAIVRSCAVRNGGEVLELRGDGFLVSFLRHDDAVACAVDIQRELAADRDAHADGGVHVRIGIHTGEVFMERGRLFGLEVVIPFRLLDCADAEDILVSGAPHDGANGVSYGPTREFTLKGIGEPVPAALVDWSRAEVVRVDRSSRTRGSAIAC